MSPAVNLSALTKLFGKNGPAEQLLVYGLLQQLLGAVLAPELEMVTRGVNELLQSTPLSPADLAEMVVRHIVSSDVGESYAKQSGVAPSDFARLVQMAGDAPAPGDLAEALRRGLIEERGAGPHATSFEQGIAEGRLGDKWREMIKQLSVREPTPADALDALLQGQLEDSDARQKYERFGGDPEHFTWLFNARGSAPTPLEASQMANRGIIPWDGTGPDATSYLQAFLEGPWRNKWAEPYRKLAEYHPPARTIVAMVRSGALSDEQAVSFFKELGMSQELAEASLRDAHHQKTQAVRELSLSMVQQLYRDQVISKADAKTMLAADRYTDEEQDFILQLEDVRRAVAAVNSAIGRVHSLYVARKIDKGQASNALDRLTVPPGQRDDLLATWLIERGANVKTLTAAEIASAFHYKVIEQDEAMAELVADGYTPRDAWILLSVREHAKLDNEPAPGPAV